MTSGNVLPSVLLALFLATGLDSVGVLSVRQTTPRAGLQLVLVTLSDPSDCLDHLSDAFESSLHLRGLAENARSSLLRFSARSRVAIESVRAGLEQKLNRAVSGAISAERPGPSRYE